MGINLNTEQQVLIADEAEAFAERVQNPAIKEAYHRLRTEAAEGEISDELDEAFANMLELGLGSGRIRALHGAHAEMEATKLFRRTVKGKELDTQFEAANRMFEALEGHSVRKITLSARGPGMYTLVVETDESRVVTNLAQAGVDVRSVEVAL